MQQAWHSYLRCRYYRDSLIIGIGIGIGLIISIPLSIPCLSLCTGISEIETAPVKTKLHSVKIELGPLHMCWIFSDL
jgi:hypothetical protein